ncbi:MAG: GntR family transcriptional regulator [Thermodesulfobacteriota bacterium]
MFEGLLDIPRNPGLNDLVYDALKSAILQHEIPNGSRLDVNQLARKLGVSRTPVNDAIQRLSVDGLIAVVPRRGTFVARMEAKDIHDLLDVRLMFELRAAELAIGRIDDGRLRSLEEILVRLDDLLAAPKLDFIQYSKLDIKLHMQPILWVNNEKLTRLYKAQNFQWYMTRLRKNTAGQREHWEIFDAYRSGSLEEVKSALTRHIEAGKIGVTEFLKETDRRERSQ